MKLSFTEFANQVADNIDDATLQIAELAKTFYCTIYNDTPGWVLRGNRLVSPVARRALESMCAPNLPPPPPDGSDGAGQCGTTYRVIGKATYQGSDIGGYVCNEEINIGGIGTFEGFLVSLTPSAYQQGVEIIIQVDYLDLVGDEQVSFFGIASNDGNFGSGRLVWNDTCSLVGNSLGAIDVRSLTVVRTDGEPDDCSTPPGYPEIPPPQPGDITTNINITTIAGDQIEYDVTINPDSDGYPSFPPVINVSGVAVGIDATGISIGEINIGTKSGGEGGEGSPDGGDIIQPPSLSNDAPTTVETEPVPIEEGEEKEVENLVAIKVDVTQMPINAKKVSGNGGKDIIYAGWISFVKDGFLYPREWIDHELNYYLAPDDNSGYNVTLKKGFKATVTEVLKDTSST